MVAEVCHSPCHYIKRFKQYIEIVPHKFQLQKKFVKRVDTPIRIRIA